MPLVRLLSSARTAAEPSVMAVADLGSNSFHLIVARVVNGQVQVLDRLQEVVRLAAGLDERQQLDRATQRRALACLERFGERLRGLAPSVVRVVGTDALRRARNRERFIKVAEKTLGHAIEIISGPEEARLIYQGAVRHLSVSDKPRLVVDIGGGSTELIIGSDRRPELAESVAIGCVNLTRQYFPKGKIAATSMHAAVTAARLVLKPLEMPFRAHDWSEALGSSGSIRAIAAVMQAQKWTSPELGITASALEKLRDLLVAAGRVSPTQLPGVSSERAPVFAGGVAALLAVFQAFEIKHLQLAAGALREGLLYDLHGRLNHDDVRAHTVSALRERYHVDAAQAERVARTARACFGQVLEQWQLNDDAGRALDWAAQLHEIGLAVAHSKYHHHGAYLLANSDMPGFAYDEQQLLAMLVRAHRRRFPAEIIETLSRARAKTVSRLSVLLRLAVLFHRGRHRAPLPTFVLSVHKHDLQLRFPRGWLALNRLTEADLVQEAAYLRAAGFRLRFS